MKRCCGNLTQRFGRRNGLAAKPATKHCFKSGSCGEARACIRAHPSLKESIVPSPMCIRTVPVRMIPITFAYFVGVSLIWLSSHTVAAATSTAALHPSKGSHVVMGTCPPVWQGTATFDCPSDIDGKKSPISFAVPLPPKTEHHNLLKACNGSVRIDVAFQRRDCELESSILKEAIHVVLWPVGTGESDTLAPLEPDTCSSELPELLAGTVVRDSDPSVPLVAAGIATTRISCCQSCSP